MIKRKIRLTITKSIALFAILQFTFTAKAQITNFSAIENNTVNLGEVLDNNENFNEFENLKPLLEDVSIVMLGEQSHGDGTVYQTKIKLIKYLHQELGFDLLVFESGFFECKKAWELIEHGENVRSATGKSVFSIWSTTKEFKPLTEYIESKKDTKNPLRLAGFDNQFTGEYSNTFFMKDLEDFLQSVSPSILETKEWENFSANIQLLTKFSKSSYKAFKKADHSQDLMFISKLITELNTVKNNPETSFWIQALNSTKSYISDVSSKTEWRDKQMAENLIWLKENNSDSKIICWGATSHFLFNSKNTRIKNPVIQMLAGNHYKKTTMMGEYIKNKYQDKAYTIGFTAYQGEFGLWSKRKIKIPKEGTLEYVLSQSKNDNFLVPLKNLDVNGLESRPLANFYMKNDINLVMDAVVFNRYMDRPRLDRNFFLEVYPDNKHIKPEAE